MRGYPSGVQDHCDTEDDGALRLTLDIERVLGVRDRQPVRAEFRYSPQAPLVVCAEFRVEGGPQVVWHLGRDLLRAGLHTRSGTGDVQVWPSQRAEGPGASGPAGSPSQVSKASRAPGPSGPSAPSDSPMVWLQLASGDMAALFVLPMVPLARWLDRTCQLVPDGAELADVDWEATTAALLRVRGDDTA